MHRRTFLLGAGIAAGSAAAQTARPRTEAVESATPDEAPSIVLSQVGFLPNAKKRVIYRASSGEMPPDHFTLQDIGGSPRPFSLTKPLTSAPGDVPNCLIGDFSDLDREGFYQITAGTERCAPF